MRAAIIPLAVLLAGCLYPEGGEADDTIDCTVEDSRRFEVATPADAPLQFRVDACRIDANACVSLCQMVLDRVGMAATATSCNVTFTADKAKMNATYARFSDACGGVDDAVPPLDTPAPN